MSGNTTQIGACLFGDDCSASVTAIILATGVENSTFQKDGTVTTGLTYMTGTLVKMGQKMVGVLAARRATVASRTDGAVPFGTRAGDRFC